MLLDNILDVIEPHKQSESVAYLQSIYGIQNLQEYIETDKITQNLPQQGGGGFMDLLGSIGKQISSFSLPSFGTSSKTTTTTSNDVNDPKNDDSTSCFRSVLSI